MQIIHSLSTSPTFNLAAEEFLFSERQDDLLFLYVNEPSVIIGCNQAIRNEVDLEFCNENNIQIVRRLSGGGAVYHDEGNLNFCFISNKTEGKSSLNDEFLKPIVDVLIDLDIPVKIGSRKDLWLQSEYKITGTASHVAKNRELHHGTLLYNTDLEMLKKALTSRSNDNCVRAIASVRSVVKNLGTYFEEQGKRTFSLIDFYQIIFNRLLEYYNQYEIYQLSENETIKIKLLEINKYCQKEWTYKK
ncbi:MAG: biotin/lipoate A/B protein ligase family protein [Paludibacter sp.]|nr:biotin/lipoate A/B protein ligase family protein [Paludibacter sp.]